MAFETQHKNALYYGQYGGCFISDAFTISCDALYEDYLRLGTEAAFVQEYRAVAARVISAPSRVQTVEAGGKALSFHLARPTAHALAGHALLAKKTGKEQAYFGARFAEEARLCAAICAILHLPVKIHLTLALREIPSLLQWLAAAGAKVETALCETFDIPEMYAFQTWIAAPEKSACLYARSNVGAFPATQMTTAFLTPWGEDLKAALAVAPDAVVAPCVSGTTALAAMKPWWESGTKLITVEMQDPKMREELDSFCGAFTKVMRDETRDRVLAPELANAWDEGRVQRVFVSAEDAQQSLRVHLGQSGLPSLSLAGAAALHIAGQTPGNVLAVAPPPRTGAVL